MNWQTIDEGDRVTVIGNNEEVRAVVYTTMLPKSGTRRVLVLKRADGAAWPWGRYIECYDDTGAERNGRAYRLKVSQ
jgi:hypothetical protein